jgi:hypothetical protein
MGSQGNLQLVPQGEVLEDQFDVASQERADQAKNQLEEFDHRGRLAAGSCEPLPSPNHQPGISRAAATCIRINFCPPTGSDHWRDGGCGGGVEHSARDSRVPVAIHADSVGT